MQATRPYEPWLASHCSPVRADLRLKHERMAENPFVFLRGTFYRWIQEWPRLCPTLLAESARWLRTIATSELRDPAEFNENFARCRVFRR